jgi:hypothetical protein
MDLLPPTDYKGGFYVMDPELSQNMKAKKMKQADLKIKGM